jgi:membrane protease subunit (stomatin/prohibitin family)
VPKVIVWDNPQPNEIVYKYPSEEIDTGSELIVRENEAAVFYRDGKVYAAFNAGRHVLTTLNFPVLEGLTKLVHGGRTPFVATVIFVSLKRFQGKFGGRSQTRELAPIAFNGSFWFEVRDVSVFVNKVVGAQSLYTTDELNNYLRGYFNERAMKNISNYSIYDLYQNLDNVTKEMTYKLREDFMEIGIDIPAIKFEGIDVTDPVWRDRLFWLRSGVAGQTVLQMETIDKAAESLGKSPGAAIGSGIVLIPPLLQQPTPQAQQPATPAPTTPPPPPPSAPAASVVSQSQQPTTYQPKCPSCGSSVPQNAKFCPNCGVQLKWCKNGHVAPIAAKFCPECGVAFL